MKKIYFALGHTPLENYIKRELDKEYLFVGGTVYKEGIIKGIVKKSPDIIIIRETLNGKEDILKILYEIRNKFPETRIVLLAGKRDIGDKFLYKVVSIGIYDVLYGSSIQTKDIVSIIRSENTYKDIKDLQSIENLTDDGNIPEDFDKKTLDKEKVEKEDKEISITKENSVKKEKKQKKNDFKEKFKIEKLKKEEESENKSKNNTSKSSLISSISKIFSNESMIDNRKKKLHHEIISFLGGKSGTGNTTLAYNTAVSLAQQGYRTIFIELDDLSPSVAYWLNIGKSDKGIETAIDGLKNDDLKKIDDSIIKTVDIVKDKNSDMVEIYKQLPLSLDFLFFSDKYLDRFKDTETIELYDLNLFKDLVLNLVFQKNYDVVVLDISSKNQNQLKKSCLSYSNKLFITLTQDIATFGYGEHELDYYKRNNIDLVKKPTYILNRFTNSKFKHQHVEKWLNSKNIIYIPDDFTKLIDSNFVGLPVVINDKKSKLSSSIQGIIKHI